MFFPILILTLATSIASLNTGTASFYGGNTHGGMCSFPGYDIPPGLYGTALSSSNWNGATPCGSCISVTGPKGNIRVMVTDQCSNCGPNHLDLYQDAFGQIANPIDGIVNVSWEFVPCGITSPLFVRNKSGTSRWWFSMQAVNSNVSVERLEVSTDGGKTWQGTVRREYNYFEKVGGGGFGGDVFVVKVTAVDGRFIAVEGMSAESEAWKVAGENFW